MLQPMAPGLGTYPASLLQAPAQQGFAKVASTPVIPSTLLNSLPLVVKPLSDPDPTVMPAVLTATAILKTTPLPAAVHLKLFGKIPPVIRVPPAYLPQPLECLPQQALHEYPPSNEQQ